MDDSIVKTHYLRQGIFSWNELMTPDLAAAKAFYTEIFGWTYTEETIAEGPMAGQLYVVAHAGEFMAAGMLPLCSPDIPPNWGAYVTVENLEDTLAKVEKMGGKVIVPGTPVQKVGIFAVIQDNAGAFLMIMQYEPQE